MQLLHQYRKAEKQLLRIPIQTVPADLLEISVKGRVAW